MGNFYTVRKEYDLRLHCTWQRIGKIIFYYLFIFVCTKIKFGCLDAVPSAFDLYLDGVMINTFTNMQSLMQLSSAYDVEIGLGAYVGYVVPVAKQALIANEVNFILNNDRSIFHLYSTIEVKID